MPHSGTRTLVKHLSKYLVRSPRGEWLHFGFDDARLRQHQTLHLHIPMRHPYAVAASHARRGKSLDSLVVAYHSMLSHLTRPHTLHKMEDIPVLGGGDDWDRNEHGNSRVSSYVDRIRTAVVEPNIKLFSQFYEDIA